MPRTSSNFSLISLAAISLLSGCSRLPNQAPTQPMVEVEAFAPTAFEAARRAAQGQNPAGGDDLAAKPADVAQVAGSEARIVTLVKRALLKDGADGFALADGEARHYGTQFLTKPVHAVETQRFDGLWAYDLAESPETFRQLHASERATTGDDGYFVPDAAIVRNIAFTIERELPVPADAPAGAKAMRVGVDIVTDPVPVKGTFVVDRVYLPGGLGRRDREVAQQQTSRELRFDVPALPALHGKPFVIKRSLARYIPIPTGLSPAQTEHLQTASEDVALSVAEEQVWPDGTVIQHQTHVADDLTKVGSKGTIILSDDDRTPLAFERAIDLSGGTSVTVLKFLDGLRVVLIYDKAGILTAGRVEADGKGNPIGAVKAKSATVAALTLAGGVTREVRLD
jgi:hypothetical protein